MGFTLSIINPPSGSRYWWADYMYGESYSGWLDVIYNVPAHVYISEPWSCPYGAYGATDLHIWVVDADYNTLHSRYGLGPIYDGKSYIYDCSTGILSEEIPLTYHLDISVPAWAAGGYVEPGSGDYPAHISVMLTAHPLSGYQFVGWGVDASGTDPTYSLFMDSDKYVEAYFEPIAVPEPEFKSFALSGYTK